MRSLFPVLAAAAVAAWAYGPAYGQVGEAPPAPAQVGAEADAQIEAEAQFNGRAGVRAPGVDARLQYQDPRFFQPAQPMRVGVRALPAHTAGFGATFATTRLGAQVVGVYEGSPAHHAGLQPGDHVVAINHMPIRSGQHAISTILSCMPGQQLVLTVLDPQGHTHQTAARLTTRQEALAGQLIADPRHPLLAEQPRIEERAFRPPVERRALRPGAGLEGQIEQMRQDIDHLFQEVDHLQFQVNQMRQELDLEAPERPAAEPRLAPPRPEEPAAPEEPTPPAEPTPEEPVAEEPEVEEPAEEEVEAPAEEDAEEEAAEENDEETEA